MENVRTVPNVRNPNIDPVNMIHKEVNGCKVRLFFMSERNERAERMVLENLMLSFDRKRLGASRVRS